MAMPLRSAIHQMELQFKARRFHHSNPRAAHCATHACNSNPIDAQMPHVQRLHRDLADQTQRCLRQLVCLRQTNPRRARSAARNFAKRSQACQAVALVQAELRNEVPIGNRRQPHAAAVRDAASIGLTGMPCNLDAICFVKLLTAYRRCNDPPSGRPRAAAATRLQHGGAQDPQHRVRDRSRPRAAMTSQAQPYTPAYSGSSIRCSSASDSMLVSPISRSPRSRCV